MSKILILGGGFGGVRAALDLHKKIGADAEITLIDRNPYHVFAALLYEVASAFDLPVDPYSVLLKKTVAIPYEEIFAGTSVKYIQAEIQKIDLHRQIVQTAGEAIHSYDYLIIGLGAEASAFGIPGVKEYACQFKTIPDALMVRQKMLAIGEQMKNGIAAPAKIFIVGAGFTGIELSAELAMFWKHAKKRLKLRSQPVHIYLFEGSDKILPSIASDERQIIRKRLIKLGIIIMERAPIEAVEDGTTLRLKNTGQTMEGSLVIWAAGVKAPQILQQTPDLPLTAAGKIIVSEHLNVGNYKNVFAVGDLIEFMDHATQKPVPALAYLAIDHGAVAAENIVRTIRQKNLIIHKPEYVQWAAPLGGKNALVHLLRHLNVGGFLGWIIKEMIDLRYFASVLSWPKAVRLLWQELQIFTKND